MMHPAIADKREELAELCRRHDVARLEIFGSAARAVDFDPHSSDADFLVKFRRINNRTLRQYFDFADALRQALGRPVDLIESGAVRNPYLQAAINKSRQLIYAA